MDYALIKQALTIIINKSPTAFRLATQALAAMVNNSPILSKRVGMAISTALGDTTAEPFTEDERALFKHVFVLWEPEDPARTVDLRLRVTPDEKLDIQQRAESEYVTISEFIRRRIFSQK